MRCFAALLCASLCLPGVGQATEFVLQLPLGAKSTYSKVETKLPALVPVGVFANGQVPMIAAPRNIRRNVWAMGGEQTLAEVQAGILAQLETAGYEPLVFCVARKCGGFDFRFGIEVVDEPEMWVNLRNYRFISAKQTVSENPAYVTFLLSRSPVSVYVQMTEYSPEKTLEAAVPTGVLETSKTGSQIGKITPPSDILMVLEGLVFETGSSAVESDPNGVIEQLADKLKADPDLKVLLVGHSDMSGSVDGNISISKSRAESVREALIQQYDVSRSRITSHGVGFLSPRADNATEDGRQKNRRVEAVFSR